MAKNQYQLVTFFLNGKKLQPSSVQDFRDQIDAALNG